MNQEKIGKFIAECRKEKNLTQEQLAERLGVSNKSVSRWENAKTMPDISLFEPLCKELDISFNELLTGEKTDTNSEYPSKEALIGYEHYIKQKSRIKIILLSVITFFAVSLSALLLVLSFNKTFFSTNYTLDYLDGADVPIPRFSFYRRTGGMDEYHTQLKTLKQPDEINVFIGSYLSTLCEVEHNDKTYYYDPYEDFTIISYRANNDGIGFINTIFIIYCDGNICES